MPQTILASLDVMPPLLVQSTIHTNMPLLLRCVYEIITLYNCWLLVVSDGPTSPGPTNLLYIHAEEEETMIDHLIQKIRSF